MKSRPILLLVGATCLAVVAWWKFSPSGNRQHEEDQAVRRDSSIAQEIQGTTGKTQQRSDAPSDTLRKNPKAFMRGDKDVPPWILVDSGADTESHWGKSLEFAEMNAFLDGALAISLPASTKPSGKEYYQMALPEAAELIRKLNAIVKTHLVTNGSREGLLMPEGVEFVSRVQDQVKQGFWSEMSQGTYTEYESKVAREHGQLWQAGTRSFMFAPEIRNALDPIYSIIIDPSSGICKFIWTNRNNG